MAPAKSPAFSFYANDFMTGTLALSLEECGAYVTLLAYQWDHGSVPDDAAARARICRCSVAQGKRVWIAISGKFQQGDDGSWRNARLERERNKQDAYRELQRDKGLASARNRATNREATEPQPSHQPEGQPSDQPKANLSSSSSSSVNTNTHTAPERRQANGANESGTLPRDHMFHAICGPSFRLCLTQAVYGKLWRRYGPDEVQAKAAITGFIEALERSVGDGSVGDHLWLLQHFDVWLESLGRVPVAPPKANGRPMAKTAADIIAELNARDAAKAARP